MPSAVAVTKEGKVPFTAAEVRAVITALKKELNFKISSLVVNFISSKQIHTVNNSYLGHDYATDIITFDYRESGQEPLDVEIFISIEDSAANARRFKVPHRQELLRLLVHGVLHCNGFTDTYPAAKRKMKAAEDGYTKKLYGTLIEA